VKRNFSKLTIIFLFLFVSINTVHAAASVAFGGKVKATTVPMVKCSGSGTIFILSSNLTSLTKAGIGAATTSSEGTEQKVQKAVAALKALGDTVPFYSTDSQKNPKVGDMIMGKAKSIPDFSTCKMRIGPYEIPFPVRKTTDNYNVAGQSKSGGSLNSGSWSGSTYNYE